MPSVDNVSPDEGITELFLQTKPLTYSGKTLVYRAGLELYSEFEGKPILLATVVPLMGFSDPDVHSTTAKRYR
jgi:hypothetical protein